MLAEAGIPHRPELVRHGAHDRDIAHAADDRAPRPADPPTAVFASSDVQATGVLAGRRGARACAIPDDLSVIGFDDIELSTYVGLTTVRQPLFESGQLGARLLLAAVAGDTPPAVEQVLPLAIVERATTAPPGRAAA